MSADFESPFLDHDAASWPRDEDRETPSPDLESPFDNYFAEAESPFLPGEATEEESPFLPGESGEEESPFPSGEAMEAQYEGEGSDPSLFDPAELEGAGEASWEASGEAGDDDESAIPAASRYETFGYDMEVDGDGSAEGEFVLVNERDNGASAGDDGSSEGEFVLVGEVDEEGQLPGDEFPVLTRILWPALGFPAVVVPGAAPKKEPSLDVDATRCLTILVLTNTPKFPANEVAKRLRVVPWSARGKRFIAEGKPGSFTADQIVVRTDQPGNKLLLPQPKDATEQLVGFGEGAGPVNRIVANLARKVRETYKGWGMEYLHEIRLSEAATAGLGEGQFHVFFNNLGTRENAPSDEMAFLIRLGEKRRETKPGQALPKAVPPREDYQYEYGTVNAPYSAKRTTKRRAEVLHPVFIYRKASPRLRIGHVTDLHVDVRQDVYAFNVAAAQKKGTLGPLSFNNWNDSVTQIYAHARKDSDMLMLTGDLIDYGRGHAGLMYHRRLGEDQFYQRDKNWLLLYDVLAGADRYTKPVYTSLGNHDWRINPYPPFAIAGAPGPATQVNDYDCFDAAKLRAIITEAHGDGADAQAGYPRRWRTISLLDFYRMWRRARQQQVTLEMAGLPTETNVDSVLWYLLTINPFFDYAWPLPSRHRLLMLDWAEDEALFFKKIENGVIEDYDATPDGIRAAARPGPKAFRSLTSTQKLMVEQFVKLKNPAKVIGMHAPALCPYDDWGEDSLRAGFIQYHGSPRRGPNNYEQRKNGKRIALNGHPLFAVPPKKGPKGRLAGMDADQGTFVQHREWFIRALAARDAGVRVVLAGHVHRAGRYGVRVGTKADGDIVTGELLLRSLEPDEVQGAAMPAVSTRTPDVLAPIYVNTTSAGPRGHNHPTGDKELNVDPGYALVELMADGVINGVSFRRPVAAPKASCDVGKARIAKKLPAFAF